MHAVGLREPNDLVKCTGLFNPLSDVLSVSLPFFSHYATVPFMQHADPNVVQSIDNLYGRLAVSVAQI